MTDDERLVVEHVAARPTPSFGDHIVTAMPLRVIEAARRAVEAPDGWRPGRWWRAVAPDGEVWAESSDEDDVRERARPGDRIEREWRRAESEWRPA